MAHEDRFFVEKVAFCSLLCAGFAYAGYSIVTKVYYKKPEKKDSKLCQTNSLRLSKTEGTQTEELMKSKSFIDDCVSPKSVRERINDLNMTERLRKNSIPVSPEIKPHSFHGSPWSSPLGCAKYLSVSCENISTKQCPSPDFKDKSKHAASQGALDVELQVKLSKLQLSESICQQMLPFQEDTITMKCLGNLQKTPGTMTTFEVKNLVCLLQSVNEDILLKTLYTISNCAAFTKNQELLCESECPKKLKNLLLNQSEAIKIAATQAVSNISVIDRSHRYFQPHIPILLNNAINGRELLKSLSLTALANLALDAASHKVILKYVHQVSLMAKTGTTVVQLQALRLLVNLSCNKDIIPLLLMTEVPSDMLDMFRKPYERELVLRLLTFLANIATFVTHFVDGSSKPTLLSVLYHFKRTEQSELTALINDPDEDLSLQAKRLHDALIGIS